MRLNELQKTFLDLVLSEDGPKAALFRSTGVSTDDRLRVYRHAILNRLENVLVATYPAIVALVGEPYFRQQMARGYIQNHLPLSGCLYYYGGAFSAFLKDHKVTKGMAFLPDLARLEWLVNESEYAPDEKVHARSPESENSEPAPLKKSARLFASRWPVVSLREYCLSEEPEDQFDIGAGGEFALVYRDGLSVRVQTVTEDEYLFLSDIRDGKTYATAAQRAASPCPYDAHFSGSEF